MNFEAIGSKIGSLAENTAVAVGLKKPRMSNPDKIISGVAFAVFAALAVALLAAGLATAGTGLGLAVSLPLVAAGLTCALVALGVLARAGYKLCKPEIEAFIEKRVSVAAERARKANEANSVDEEARAAAAIAATERRERYAEKHNAIADKYGSSRRRL
jgi:hypothetical protein